MIHDNMDDDYDDDKKSKSEMHSNIEQDMDVEMVSGSRLGAGMQPKSNRRTVSINNKSESKQIKEFDKEIESKIQDNKFKG